ncbi:hypothetical protein Salat_1904600 [Sesamum alatum]|uniref:Uncharacterized protein n=1 Tax=Sesamum alatum TaxID=300844 RepID=A0AAE1Y3Y5_9LAMI|nr:hypothetical protein Salat_1904600 [Sesamum alatum]
MADPNPRPQETYFYTTTLTRRHNNTFIHALYTEALRGEAQNNRCINIAVWLILDTWGVMWDVGRNRLEVQNNVWEAIYQDNPFANAYSRQGEAQSSKLEIIFVFEVDDPESDGEEGVYVGDNDYSSTDATGSESESESNPDYMAYSNTVG